MEIISYFYETAVKIISMYAIYFVFFQTGEIYQKCPNYLFVWTVQFIVKLSKHHNLSQIAEKKMTLTGLGVISSDEFFFCYFSDLWDQRINPDAKDTFFN